MRTFFFLLLLANLAFYGWHAGYIGPEPQPVGEPGRLAQQINPGKIRIVNAGDANKAAPPKPTACLEWSGFPPQENERMQVLLAAMNPAPRFSTRRVDESAGWWVFLPPQPNKAAADKKGAELRQLKVPEFFVISEDGPNKYAISLGVFKTEEAAKNYLETLSRQGVKTARATERETRVAKTSFTFREVDDALKARLVDLKKEFAGQDLKDCAPDTKGDDKRN